MLLKNLSLVLGIAAAGTTGTVVTIQQHQQNVNNVVAKAEAPELACHRPRQKTPDFYKADTYNQLMRDIYIVNNFTREYGYTISNRQHQKNIDNLIEYCNTYASEISNRDGRLLVDHQEVKRDVPVYKELERYENNHETARIWKVPDSVTEETINASWNLKPVYLSSAIINFNLENSEEKASVPLHKMWNASTTTKSTTETNVKGPELIVSAHTGYIVRRATQNIKTEATGSVVYDIDTTKDGGEFTINVTDLAPHSRYCQPAYPKINLKKSIEMIRERDSNAFSKTNRDIFIYENEKVMFNVPLTWTIWSSTASTQFVYIELNK